MSNELTTNKDISVTDDQINQYLESMGNNLKDYHRNQFTQLAKAFDLNPFKREIYGIQYGNNFNIIIGYEVFLKRAELSNQLDGWRVWTAMEGDEMKACIEIHRKDRNHPFYHEVFLNEYHQNNQMWKSKTRTMIKKVAIAQGFRMCFPVEFSGMPYIEEEVSASNEKEVNQKQKTKTKASQAYSEMINKNDANDSSDQVEQSEQPDISKQFKKILRDIGVDNKETYDDFIKFSEIELDDKTQLQLFVDSPDKLKALYNDYLDAKVE